ncbi:hypothetical protein AB833_31370 [Chromatiales bacterium (ex Bugula neritina AB1)]|nr:hypothetical protein AB833_31370 [Chromatiales bacterium (ex Bugula neritina AB1)]
MPSATAATLPHIKTSTETTTTDLSANLDSPEAVRAMMFMLSDEQVRQVLAGELDAKVAVMKAEQTQTVSQGVIAFFSQWASGIYDSAKLSIIKLPEIPATQIRVAKNFISRQGEGGLLPVFTVLGLALALGFLAEWGVTLLTRKWQQQIANPVNPDSYRESFKLLSLRFALDMAGLITFIVVMTIVIDLIQLKTADGFSYLIMNNLIFLPRLILAISRFLLAPNRPELRIVHTDEWTARFLHRHQFGLILLIGVGNAWIKFMIINGALPDEMLLGYWINLAVHAYFIFIVWHARNGLTEMISRWDREGTHTKSGFARVYPYLLIFASIFTWLVFGLIVSYQAFHLLQHEPNTVTLFLLLSIPVFDTLIRTAVASIIPPTSGTGEVASKAYQSTKLSYIRVGRALLFGGALFIMGLVWQIQLYDLTAQGVGSHVATDIMQLLVILSIGYVIWEVVTLWINHKLASEATAAGIDLKKEEPGGGEGGGGGASRLSTTLPLLRFFLQSMIVVMTLFIALSNIGINITPLLAGAGVIGIAVGFGAQKLVQDIVSGLFFLIDDAFRAGEYVSIEDTLGTVEKISLRSMQLRHHRGAIHTIPYGEIPKLTNYSRDWVIMKLQFTLPFDTELHKVKKIFKQIGKEMMEVEEFKDDFIQPFKSQGVLEVNDVGIVMRGKFMAKPGTQFTIRKELYNRVQKAFDENGLQFARKEVRVKLQGEESENLNEQQKAQIAGAASEAVQEKSQEQQQNNSL